VLLAIGLKQSATVPAGNLVGEVSVHRDQVVGFRLCAFAR